jgi:hypothetical protein
MPTRRFRTGLSHAVPAALGPRTRLKVVASLELSQVSAKGRREPGYTLSHRAFTLRACGTGAEQTIEAWVLQMSL